MNDSEVHSPSLDKIKATAAEFFAPKPLSKASSAKNKLRQLVNKTCVISTHSNSPNQTQQHLSKHGHEGSLWEAYSPAVSRISDSSQLVSTKVKHNSSPKLKSSLHAKPPSKNSSYSLHSDLDPNKIKEIVKKTKPQATSSLSTAIVTSSPKNEAYRLFSSGANSTKDSGFNPQSYMNFLAAQPKTCQNKDSRLIKTNSLSKDTDVDDECEEDDGNLSLEIKAKPSIGEQLSKKTSNARNLSQDSQSITPSLIKEHTFPKAETSAGAVTAVEKPKRKKSKPKMSKKGSTLNDTKKKTESLKTKLVDGVKNQSTEPKLTKKNSLQINNASFFDIEKNKKEVSVEKPLQEKRKAMTPDNLTSRETEQSALESKLDKSPAKLGKIYNDILARKASMPVTKDMGLGAKKRPTSSSNKDVKSKIGPKLSKKLKDTSQDNILERGKSKKSDGLDPLMPRSTKGSSPNIFGGLMSNAGYSLNKNYRRGINPQEFIHGEQERNGISSNEVTICGTQDTTGNMKGQNRKDITVEECDETTTTTKGKRFTRARSQGGSVLIEEILDDLNKGEKLTKNEGNTRIKRNSSEIQNLKEKRSQGMYKSVDYSDGIWDITEKDGNNKELNHNVLSMDSENASDNKGLEESQTAADKVTMLCKLLERTNKLLTTYKDRETTWQSEKQELLKVIKKLQVKGNNH